MPQAWSACRSRFGRFGTFNSRRETREAIDRFRTQLLVNVLTSALRSLDMIEKARYKERIQPAYKYCVEAPSPLRELTTHPNLSAKERAEIDSIIEDLGKIQRGLQTMKSFAKTERKSQSIGGKLHEMTKIIGRIKGRLETTDSETLK